VRRSTLLPLLVTCAIASLAGPSGATAAVPTAAAASSCAKYASTSGSDAAAGTQAAPYRTAQKLVDSLGSGQVGCLRAGTYSQNVSIGRSDVTLTAAPGEQATLVGRLWIKDGANGVVVTGLNLDGKNAAALPSPTVNGDGAQFVGNDVTNDHTEICFLVGSSWGRAQGTVISGNRIHDCGKLPSSNEDHGIYVSEADDTQIVDNVIYDNVDRGVQLYPDAQRTTVRGNIIEGNGEGIIFSGDDGTASNDNVVEHNVIASSNIRSDVESWYPSGNPKGTGNVVRSNCLTKAPDASSGGFTATGNLVVSDPKYVSRSTGDFRLASDSPCATTLSASEAPAGPFWEAPDSDATAPPSTGGSTTPPPDTSGSTTPPPSTGGSTTPPPDTSGSTTRTGGKSTRTHSHNRHHRSTARAASGRRSAAATRATRRIRRCVVKHHGSRAACAKRARHALRVHRRHAHRRAT
jgi:nitrous oxidase accessory protein NosD